MSSALSSGKLKTAFFSALDLKPDIKPDQEKEQEGLELLSEAMSLGRKQGYLNMVYWWYSPVIAKLCAKALTEGIEVDYVKSLIRIHKLTPESPPYHIENWPWALKIHTFDRFQIIKDDEPIRFSGKTQKKPFDLLKVLVAYGGIGVNVEQIIDALWYEADWGYGSQRFIHHIESFKKAHRYKRHHTASGRKSNFESKLLPGRYLGL